MEFLGNWEFWEKWGKIGIFHREMGNFDLEKLRFVGENGNFVRRMGIFDKIGNFGGFMEVELGFLGKYWGKFGIVGKIEERLRFLSGLVGGNGNFGVIL